MWPGGCELCHAPEAWAEDFGDLKKSQLVEFLASEEQGWLSLVHQGLVAGVHVVWGRWKSQVYLSPYVEKRFNSKVKKSFVPELRSRKCFLCFGIPMIYMNILWTLYVRFTYSCMGMLHMLGVACLIPLSSSHLFQFVCVVWGLALSCSRTACFSLVNTVFFTAQWHAFILAVSSAGLTI